MINWFDYIDLDEVCKCIKDWLIPVFILIQIFLKTKLPFIKILKNIYISNNFAKCLRKCLSIILIETNRLIFLFIKIFNINAGIIMNIACCVVVVVTCWCCIIFPEQRSSLLAVPGSGLLWLAGNSRIIEYHFRHIY